MSIRSSRRRKTPVGSQIPTVPGAPGVLGADEVFGSAHEMVQSVDSLIRFLNHYYAKENAPGGSTVLGFVIERLIVQFTPDVEAVEICTQFAQSTLVVLAPALENETETSRQERRISLLKDFLPTLKEAQIRATVQLYRTLSPEAKRGLAEKHHEVDESHEV